MTTAVADPLADLRAEHRSAGWWVYHWGGLFDAEWAESPAVAHIVNIGRGPSALCGRPRFQEGAPGGSWGPALDRLGGLQLRPGEPRIEPCRPCLDALATTCAVPREDTGFDMWVHVIQDERAR